MLPTAPSGSRVKWYFIGHKYKLLAMSMKAK